MIKFQNQIAGDPRHEHVTLVTTDVSRCQHTSSMITLEIMSHSVMIV